MPTLIQDPLTQLVHFNIKKGINICLENGCVSSAVILAYSGMDTMAYLNLPAGKEEVERADFIRWADRYVRFPCKEQLSGADLYGARCAMLHQHGVMSTLYHQGKCRRVGYLDKSVPEVLFNPKVSPNDVLVSAPALAEAFFRGIDDFLVDLFSDLNRRELAEKRLSSVVVCHPLRSSDSESRTAE